MDGTPGKPVYSGWFHRVSTTELASLAIGGPWSGSTTPRDIGDEGKPHLGRIDER